MFFLDEWRLKESLPCQSGHVDDCFAFQHTKLTANPFSHEGYQEGGEGGVGTPRPRLHQLSVCSRPVCWVPRGVGQTHSALVILLNGMAQREQEQTHPGLPQDEARLAASAFTSPLLAATDV